MMFWNSAHGIMQIKITGAEPGKTMQKLTEQGIALYDIQWLDELTVILQCFRKDRRSLEAICVRQGDEIHFLGEKGIFLWWKKAWQRPVLSAGIMILLTLTLFIPTRVLFFQVEGNERLPENRILEAAQVCGIRFGVSRRGVRSEQIKNRLLDVVPELKWAGINTSGCTAVISVREQPQQETKPVSSGVSSIVASRDGRITSCTVTRGNALCVPGQVVQEGQLLVSGYTDCGICVQITEADGEIFAETYRQMTAVTPDKQLARVEEMQSRKRYSLILGKKRINLWKGSGISDATCGRMYKEYYITLPGGFRLPVCLISETLTDWKTAETVRQAVDTRALMESFSREQTTGDTVAGSILREDHAYSEENGLCCLKSTFFCSEMIGRVITEEIGETNGKTD